jgi:hypothetical protein
MYAIVNYQNDYNNGKKSAFIHLKADKLEYTNSHIYVFDGDKLQGVFALEFLYDAFLTEKENGK